MTHHSITCTTGNEYRRQAGEIRLSVEYSIDASRLILAVATTYVPKGLSWNRAHNM
jgi:hypothetical protein